MLDSKESFKKKWTNNVQSFLNSNPFFDEQSFLDKMTKRFHEYEVAQENRDITSLLPYLSNGLIRELTTRFKADSQVKKSHKTGNITLSNVSIDRVEEDGDLFLLYIHFEGTMDQVDKRRSIKMLEKKVEKTFSTYWVVFRNKEGKRLDFTTDAPCPLCGNPTIKNRCSSCNCELNNGSYSWILSRIMTEQDLLEKENTLRSNKLYLRQQILSQVFPKFTVHGFEDTVYNGFMQIIAARMENEPTLLRPIFSDRFYERESMGICDASSIYSGVNLNTITLAAIERLYGHSNLFCNISFTAQRIDLTNPKKSDSAAIQRNAVIHLIRQEPGEFPVGNLYEGSCPICRKPVHYEVDAECPHCKNQYNTGKAEWVIADILSPTTFDTMLSNGKHHFDFAVSEQATSDILSIRDYVLNNVMVICAADRIITTEEVQFIDDLAIALQYSATQREKIHKILAGSGSLRLRLPQKLEDKKRVFELMKQAASIDNEIAPQEQEILSHIEQEILQEKETIL